MALDPQILSTSLLGIAVICSLVSILFTANLFRQYFKHWTQPKTQNLVMRVILLVPIWAILSTIIVGLPTLRYITAIFLDLYEGFAILSFMQLIYHYLGGRDQAQTKASLKHPYRCFGCCCYLYPGERFIQVLHVIIYQYAFTRPFFAIVTCALYYNGLLETGGLGTGKPAGPIVTIVAICCLILAMWGLLQMYRTFNLILQPNNVGSKFMAIKLYIFLHAVQGFVFERIEANQADEERELIIVRCEYALVCFEMMIGSILNNYVFFKYQEYIDYETLESDKIRLEGKSYTESQDSTSTSFA